MENNEQNKKGNRINGRKASLNSYMPFYDFLLFDPKYRGMKDKAKILYAYLRKKADDWKNITEKFEEGIEGFTKSYRDEKGDIYLIADNTELSIVLQCHVNRVKDFRDELQKYGLLDIVERNKKSHLLYVLIPEEDQITEVWSHIQEMNEKREKLKKESVEKAKKHQEKMKKEREKEKQKKSNSQNVSWSNSQNVSWSNSQNVGQIYLKGFKSNLNSSNYNLNLSIYEDIEKMEVPEVIKIALKQNIDRLIDDEINLVDVKNNYELRKNTVDADRYSLILNRVLKEVKTKIIVFDRVMNTSIDKELHKIATGKVTDEIIPEWFQNRNKQDENNKTNTEEQKKSIDLEAEKKKLEMLLQKKQKQNARG